MPDSRADGGCAGGVGAVLVVGWVRLGVRAIAVNRELVLLYWHIGREILTHQQQQGWGAKVIDKLAKDLQTEFPDMKGFSPRNLKYMRAFAEAYPKETIVQEVLAQIT